MKKDRLEEQDRISEVEDGKRQHENIGDVGIGIGKSMDEWVFFCAMLCKTGPLLGCIYYV